MILPLLFVSLVYGMSSTPDACAVPPDVNWSGGSCSTDPSNTERTCCWTEKHELSEGTIEVKYCQTCSTPTPGGLWDCKKKVAQLTTPPTTGESVLPGGGVAEQPEQPPLFGQNVPPTGGIEQPFTSIPFQQIPRGQVQPFIQSETPPTLSPTPTPPPPLPPPTQTGPTVAPQDDEGGGLPATQNQENVPLDGGAADQPEDNGQEESSEGAETAGPLT